jgi:hypothetical protein
MCIFLNRSFGSSFETNYIIFLNSEAFTQKNKIEISFCGEGLY